MPTIPRVYISTYNIKYLAFTSHNIFLILISAFYPLSGPHMWEQVLYPELPGILAYFPFACRLAAFTLFTPFGVCIILDIVAYAIARTLHLTITPRRVPRSPPTLTSQILTEAGPVTEADSDSSSTASSSS